jgi:DNA/RNA-binding domain of Phe-tRNA-synthetase-like protein
MTASFDGVVSVAEGLDELDVAVVWVRWPEEIGAMESPEWLRQMCALDVQAPCARSAQITTTVRELLRSKLYKPRGMYKPASEYLVKAVEAGRLGPHFSINVAVDVCNVISLHSGLPVSVVDVALLDGDELEVREMPEGSSYVFNPSGQEFKLDGLMCLCDATGALANPVKDSQRTKTRAQTRQTLYVVWGAQSLIDRTAVVTTWLEGMLERLGAHHALVK